MDPLTSEKKVYTPPVGALICAERIVQMIFESNGNPEVMHLDQKELAKVVAFAIDSAIKATGEAWK